MKFYSSLRVHASCIFEVCQTASYALLGSHLWLRIGIIINMIGLIIAAKRNTVPARLGEDN